MAVAQGYGKTVTSGSVFAYDTGDTRNSYKGKPTTNLLTTISKAGTVNDTYFKTNSGTEIKLVSNVGVRTVHYVNIYNDYNGGSGNCCPAPMYFGDFTISPSTLYTYQIIYRTTTGYANTNYMYHYEYNGGSYVTEYGLWSDSRQEDLGDGWKHAWGTFTSNASANRFITYLFHYEYGVWNKIEVAGTMLTQGNNIIPPSQFIDVNTTRSSTQGLLPLVGSSTLDLTNVSFDSNAQMTFDGTDDYIDFNAPNLGSTATVEMVCKIGSGYSDKMFMGWLLYDIYTAGGSIGYNTANGDIYGISSSTVTSLGIVNNWAHYIFEFRTDVSYTNNKIYINGVSQALSQQYGSEYSFNRSFNSGNGRIASWRTGGYHIPMSCAIFKVYNRALSAGEVQQNYRHYKTRFNLS